MAIRFDHVQAAKSAYMVLNAGSTDSKLKAAATYSNEEIYRSYINPGFNGTLEWLEAQLSFTATGTGTANTLTGKWQIRARGETTWTDLVSIPSTALSATPATVQVDFLYDAVAATNTSPWELRLIFSTTASTTVEFTFNSATLATRSVGESV